MAEKDLLEHVQASAHYTPHQISHLIHLRVDRIYSRSRLLNLTGFFSNFGGADPTVMADMLLRRLHAEWP